LISGYNVPTFGAKIKDIMALPAQLLRSVFYFRIFPLFSTIFSRHEATTTADLKQNAGTASHHMRALENPGCP